MYYTIRMLYIASDHAGFKVKEYLKSYLIALNRELTDVGPEVYTPGDDYPIYADKLCRSMQDGDIGILICDTGIGMSIAANRHKHIRAALCASIFDAMRAREHNNANVFVAGAETNDLETIKTMLKVFLDTSFSNEERHVRRVNEIDVYD